MTSPMISAVFLVCISSLAVDLHSPTAHGRRVRARGGQDAAPTGRSAAPCLEGDRDRCAVAINVAPSLEGEGDIEMGSFTHELARQGVLHAAGDNSALSTSESARVSRLSRGTETASAVQRRAGKFTRRFSSGSMAVFGDAVDQMRKLRKQRTTDDDQNESDAAETRKTSEENAVIVQMMDGANITRETPRFEYLALQTKEHRKRTAGDLMMGLGALVFVQGTEEPLDPAFVLDNVFPRVPAVPAAAAEREQRGAVAVANPLQQGSSGFGVSTSTGQNSDTAASKRVLFAIQDQRVAEASTAFAEDLRVLSRHDNTRRSGEETRRWRQYSEVVTRILEERRADSNREENGVVIDKFYAWQFSNVYTPTLADRYVAVRTLENCTRGAMVGGKRCCNRFTPSLEFCQNVAGPATMSLVLATFFLVPVLLMIGHAQPCVSETDFTKKLGLYSCWAERGELWTAGYRPAIFSRDQFGNLIFTFFFMASWVGAFFAHDCSGCFGFCGLVAYALKMAVGPVHGVITYYNYVFDADGVFTLQSQLSALNASHFASTNTSLLPEGLGWMGATEQDFSTAKMMAILDITFGTMLFVVMLLFSSGHR